MLVSRVVNTMGMKMTKMRMRVAADRAEDVKEHHSEMGMGDMIEVIPVSLYGERTSYPKGTDLKEVEADIQEVFGLE